MVCEEVWQTSWKGFGFEAASSGDIVSEGALEDEDWVCDVVINTGWAVAEEGGVLGRHGEYVGETFEWGDDGELVEYWCEE